MNIELRKEFYKLFDEGYTDFCRLDKDRNASELKKQDLAAIYFRKLSLLQKIDYLAEFSEKDEDEFYKAVDIAFVKQNPKSVSMVGITFMQGLQKRLDAAIEDLFNEAFQDYKLNNLINENARLNDFDIDFHCDYNQRVHDLQ